MAHISNAEVFALESSIYRSGYPMLGCAPSEAEFLNEVKEVSECISNGNFDNKHIRRAIQLTNTKGGGHDQFLTGIVVNFDLTISNKAWAEAERYTFLNFISSMSSMHRASVFPIRECCNHYVSEGEIEAAEAAQIAYKNIDGSAYPEEKKAAYLSLLYNIPSGFELMAGMTTNYRCLKNIYRQRRGHRLPDWHVVCDWIETLPLADKLIIGGVV
jgi:hypothetical protein